MGRLCCRPRAINRQKSTALLKSSGPVRLDKPTHSSTFFFDRVHFRMNLAHPNEGLKCGQVMGRIYCAPCGWTNNHPGRALLFNPGFLRAADIPVNFLINVSRKSSLPRILLESI